MQTNAEHAARLLGAVRIVVFGLWSLTFVSTPLADIAALPLDLLDPPLVLAWIPLEWWRWLLSPQCLTALQVVLVVLSLLAAVGVRPYRAIAAFAVVLITFHQGLVRGLSYSSHAELVALLASYVLVLWPADDRLALSLRPRPLRSAEIYGSGIFLMAALICWTYAATGIHRLAHHPVEMFVGESMSIYVVQNSFRFASGSLGTFLLEHPWATALISLSVVPVTVMEVLAPLALISARCRRVFLVFVVAFHLISAVVLHVFFWQSMIVAIAVLIALEQSRSGSVIGGR